MWSSAHPHKAARTDLTYSEYVCSCDDSVMTAHMWPNVYAPLDQSPKLMHEFTEENMRAETRMQTRLKPSRTPQTSHRKTQPQTTHMQTGRARTGCIAPALVTVHG